MRQASYRRSRADYAPGRRPAAVPRASILIALCAALLAGRQPAAAQPAPGGSQTVPVSTGKVARQDVPIWLHALGTVQATLTVQVRPRVDGTLMQVPVAEGQEVKQGELLAVIDPRPYQAALDAAAAKKQQDEAQLANAQADLTRYSSLARQDFASRQQVDTQHALVKQVTATIAADAAQVEAAQLNLSYCYITAPFAGRVGLRSVDPGTFVRAAETTSLLPLAQIRPIAVTFTLPQDRLPAVQAALRQGKAPVVAYSADDKTELDRGTLLTIDNTIDTTTGTIKLKASFPNEARNLWPGQFINARLLVGTTPDALTVASAAVQHGQDRLYVYVLNPANQTVAAQTVEVARDDGNVAVITHGLQDGQVVVTDGQSRLQNGSHVSIIGGEAKQAANKPTQAGG